METEQRGEQSISLSMFRIAEMTASVVTNRGKGGQIKRGGNFNGAYQNQYSCIFVKNSVVIGYPLDSPITESIHPVQSPDEDIRCSSHPL